MHKPIDVDAEKFDSIFGRKDELDTRPGRRRKCKSCGDWHLLSEPWPHNCRTIERPMQILKAPMLIPDVEPHKHGDYVITTRSEQRDFMKETGSVPFETFEPTAGAAAAAKSYETKEYKDQLVKDIIRGMEEDPLNRPPPLMVEEANSKVTDEEKIDTTKIEVADATSKQAI